MTFISTVPQVMEPKFVHGGSCPTHGDALYFLIPSSSQCLDIRCPIRPLLFLQVVYISCIFILIHHMHVIKNLASANTSEYSRSGFIVQPEICY